MLQDSESLESNMFNKLLSLHIIVLLGTKALATSLLVAWFQPLRVISRRVFFKKGDQVSVQKDSDLAKVTRLLSILR